MFCILYSLRTYVCFFFFFFNDTATTEIYTLSLHDALPISPGTPAWLGTAAVVRRALRLINEGALDEDSVEALADRKSTRLNSSHSQISYAVFCLKKKKNTHSERMEQYSAHARD